MTNPYIPSDLGVIQPYGVGYADSIVSDIAPFTRRNTATFLTKIEYLIAWVKESIDTVTDNERKLLAAFLEIAEKLRDDVISNAIELQDDAFAGLMADDTTASYGAVNALLHDIIKPDPDDVGTFLINDNPQVNPDGLQPDPNDEGFFV